jgi:hypothetical protein
MAEPRCPFVQLRREHGTRKVKGLALTLPPLRGGPSLSLEERG